MLSFCIPTHNRAEKLRLCLESIGELTKGFPVDIHVYNNASTDHTIEVLEEAATKYPVYFKTGTEKVDFGGSYGNAISMATQPWTWTFGDDDLLIDFNSIFPFLHTGVEFIHVTEKTRSNGGSDIYPGTLLNLCKGLGWIDMTGLISGNIFRTEQIRSIPAERMKVYNESAYPQSLAALHAFHDRPSLLVDTPAVCLQDSEQTVETAIRWEEERTTMKYPMVADGLQLLVKDGILDPVLTAEFFRYLGGNFIAKCMHAYWSETINKSTKLSDEKWSKIEILASMYPEDMKPVVSKFRSTLNEYCDVCEKGLALVTDMEKLCADATPYTYPANYV